jgi:hypothetical protein
VAFVAWTATLNSILTLENLIKRKVVVVVNRCIMCKCSCETVEHLVLHCLIAQELWSFAFTTFGVVGVMPRQVVDLLLSWRGAFDRH